MAVIMVAVTRTVTMPRKLNTKTNNASPPKSSTQRHENLHKKRYPEIKYPRSRLLRVCGLAAERNSLYYRGDLNQGTGVFATLEYCTPHITEMAQELLGCEAVADTESLDVYSG